MNTELERSNGIATQIALAGMPITPQELVGESWIEPADFNGPETATTWVSSELISEWVAALALLLTSDEHRDFEERLRRGRPYDEQDRPRWGTTLNLYLWALLFQDWSAGEGRELPAGEYVEGFVKATGIPGPQPTDATLDAWTEGLCDAGCELRSLKEFVTAMTRYRAMHSPNGDAFLPRQIAAIERFTGIKAEYAD